MWLGGLSRGTVLNGVGMLSPPLDWGKTLERLGERDNRNYDLPWTTAGKMLPIEKKKERL